MAKSFLLVGVSMFLWLTKNLFSLFLYLPSLLPSSPVVSSFMATSTNVVSNQVVHCESSIRARSSPIPCPFSDLRLADSIAFSSFPILTQGYSSISISQRYGSVVPHKNRGETRLSLSAVLSSSNTPMNNTNIRSASSLSPTEMLLTRFSLKTALFAAGLAFDVYVEPPANSSRWEKGSGGMKIGFVSPSYTRSLYRGIVKVSIQNCTHLPSADSLDQESMAETIISGKGIDTTILVAIIEGKRNDDLLRLQKSHPYHEGVLDIQGAAHIAKSRTAWAGIDSVQSERARKSSGRAIPYFVPPSRSSWVPLLGQDIPAKAFFPDEDPFYLYVQDPAEATLVWTILDADQILGPGRVLGSAITPLKQLIPAASWTSQQLINHMKEKVIEQVQQTRQSTQKRRDDKKNNTIDIEQALETALAASSSPQVIAETQSFDGSIPLTSKPRKKDRNSQMMIGAAAGAVVAGPMGAAAGAFLGNLYEADVQGKIGVQIRYMPIPEPSNSTRTTKKYTVFGGMPGINWGELFSRYEQSVSKRLNSAESKDTKECLRPLVPIADAEDLEHCFVINHEVTGASCAVYRSLQCKYIVVSFRGTCVPIDLLTDATIVQDAWVKGDDVGEQNYAKVHSGFRTSLDSISRRLKELILAAVGPGEKFSEYDLLVTGHSLGGALATLFTADVGQYGFDAGRGLPQLEASQPWWSTITNTIFGQEAMNTKSGSSAQLPPRPKSLRMYNFGSPRVGNIAFAELFDALLGEGYISEAYRIVNGDDVVARMPRTINALIFGKVLYEHVAPTVLISQPSAELDGMDSNALTSTIWIEGESDNAKCPVRDGVMLSSPTAEGSLLAELLQVTKGDFVEGKEAAKDDSISNGFSWNLVSDLALKVVDRIQTLTAADIASVIGIDRQFTDREIKLAFSLLQGRALAHHLEDQYYAGMGRAAGLVASVGEEIRELPVDNGAKQSVG
jgi:hypothetical protein